MNNQMETAVKYRRLGAWLALAFAAGWWVASPGFRPCRALL